jgi:preprotein translocase subunit YajC
MDLICVTTEPVHQVTSPKGREMRGMRRLIEGLQQGDPTAITILIVAIVATVIIYFITQRIQRQRRK